MSSMRDRARAQFPMILLTLISIIQALALELLWSQVTDSAFLYELNTAALLGWGMVREPLLNSTDALASRRDHWRGALPPACVGLSRRGNEASGLVWRPLRARPVGRHCVVVPLGKGLAIPCA